MPRPQSYASTVVLLATVLGTSPSLSRAQENVDTLLVTRTARLAGGSTCAWGRGGRSALEKGPHKILVRSTQDDGKTAEPFGGELLVLVDGARMTAPEATESERVLAGKAESWAGKQVAIVTLKDGTLICSAQLAALKQDAAPPSPARPAFPVAKNFTLLTGAEFSSADGFSSKQLRVPVTAEWFVPLKNVTAGKQKHHIGFLSLTARGEATSLVRARTRVECSPITQTGATTAIAPTVGFGFCGRARVDTLGAGSYRVTQYVRRIDAIGPDTTPTTGLVWRATADARFERNISQSNRAYLGVLASIGIETNPNVPSSRSIERRSRFGLSLRHLDEAGAEVFEMSVTHGRSHVFPVSEVLLRSVDDTVGILERRPLAAQRVKATTWRLMVSPGGGYYLRFLANLNPGFPESASLAILKSLDFPELVQSVFGSKK